MFDKDNKNGLGCFSEEELVSYLYGEVGESDRNSFDQHFLTCTACTDEFAGISDSRFSVYQWQKIAFARLETPEITGPWQSPVVREVISEPVKPDSWLKELIAGISRRRAFSFATLTILVMGSVVLGVFLSRSQDLSVGVAVNKVTSPVQPDTAVAQAEVAQNTSFAEGPNHVATKESDKPRTTIRYAKARVPSIPPTMRSEVASTDVAPRDKVSNRKALRLSEFDEEDDNGVRLADLLAETDREK